MYASPMFVSMTDQALADIWRAAPFYLHQHMAEAEYAVKDQPEARDLNATASGPNDILLGMYEPYFSPPKITLFESSIIRAQHKFGDIYSGIRSVLMHEIYEHHFGMDHTKETLDAGMAPAYMVKEDGSDINQWELKPSVPPCLPCQQAKVKPPTQGLR